ncbi:hypothetical protein PHPALM_562 [Phytophthora palmivora]|uniref:Uncharacterized protein n=1 Tax=Phytophthora palmivora TaxID=4796 RepID=A0A2P4YUJ2_9STRA|nr:hypothetical protein PHPALM_562 [Phytophthora palmivora]
MDKLLAIRDSRLELERQSAQVLATLKVKDTKISELQKVVSEQQEQLDVVLDELERRETKEDKGVQFGIQRQKEDASVQTETIRKDIETQTEKFDGESGALVLLEKLEKELKSLEEKNLILERELQQRVMKREEDVTENTTVVMRSHVMAYAESEVADALAGESTDQYGIPLSIAHSPQTNLPVWQFIHRLETPFPNPKSSDRPHTHICVLCAADPPVRASGKRMVSWRSALMRQRMSTNAVSHIQRVHPDEFSAIVDHKQRKREAAANTNEPMKKKIKRTPGPKRKTAKIQENKENGPVDTVSMGTEAKNHSTNVLARRRTVGKTTDLLKTWLISSGLPVSTLQDETFQQLLKLSNSTISELPTALNLGKHVEDEFVKFGSFLRSYLEAESQAAMELPFLSLRHEFRPIVATVAEDGVTDDLVPNQEKAFLSVAVGFIDSKWRRVDLVVAAKEVPRARQGTASSSVDDDEETDDDDEISALLMVDGPKNQPPAAPSTTSSGKRSDDAVAQDEARAWREWQQVYVAWDTLANEGADLFDKGQYNLLKLYHHVNILKWFRDVGEHAHPAASLLARLYLGQQPPLSRALGVSILRFTKQEAADWVSGAAHRAEKRCILHYNWSQYQKLNRSSTLTVNNDRIV